MILKKQNRGAKEEAGFERNGTYRESLQWKTPVNQPTTRMD